MDKIRIGDTVRFSYDTTPRIYLIYSNISVGAICIVDDMQDGNAVVKYDDGEQIKTLVIPTKYLIKVDEDEKEPTAPVIKVGDNVRNIITGEVGRVLDIQRHVAKVGAVCDWKDCYWDLNNIEVFVPKAEECHYTPTEAEEDARIRQKEAELEAFKKSELDRVLHPEKSHTYEVTFDNVTMDWQRYEANLAKEVALKVANKYNGPEQAAEYAVSVAKAVVEGLKRK